MKYAVHDHDYYLSGHRCIIAWKLYPINEDGQIIDEDNHHLFGSGQLFFPVVELTPTWDKSHSTISSRVET